MGSPGRYTFRWIRAASAGSAAISASASSNAGDQYSALGIPRSYAAWNALCELRVSECVIKKEKYVRSG
jgi:hypothetical protein